MRAARLVRVDIRDQWGVNNGGGELGWPGTDDVTGGGAFAEAAGST